MGDTMQKKSLANIALAGLLTAVMAAPSMAAETREYTLLLHKKLCF
jgi:hypothetical protein